MAGVILALTQSHPFVGLGLGAVAGAAFALALRARPDASADTALTTATLGIAAGIIVDVLLEPVLRGRAPQWTAAGMRAVFPGFVGWLLFGVAFGFGLRGFTSLGTMLFGAPPGPAPESSAEPTHVVILGGGFAGVAVAKGLERAFGLDPAVDLTLVSETNALLFTPMLAEVAAGSLEATHITAPLRTNLRRTAVVRGRVTEVDFERRFIRTDDDARIPYDHVVFALGAVSNYLGLDGVEQCAFDFKTLFDAIRIRNHVIDVFERADRHGNETVRERLLTFVIAGGGFAAVELAGALNDFARGILSDYTNLNANDVRVTLVHSRDRILPELSASLAAYALERMMARGVTFRLGARVADASAGCVTLKSGETIACETLVWTAGTSPSPLLRKVGLRTDSRGAAVVDATLAVPERYNVWALGACAAVADAKTGAASPPTAQFALRQARTLARNIAVAHKGGKRAPAPFHFDSLGSLCVIGDRGPHRDDVCPAVPARDSRRWIEHGMGRNVRDLLVVSRAADVTSVVDTPSGRLDRSARGDAVRLARRPHHLRHHRRLALCRLRPRLATHFLRIRSAQSRAGGRRTTDAFVARMGPHRKPSGRARV
ncbi:MAG: NAD(P)/FAD-dependent oxidoreductase [Candidatus Eremiobacteraeota bacterium]|nr:NAD(P)/FAD-dependent oxidoreductase [Candidatus Eremiobacteraeota bacterium]MBC5822065.1 NAD(P)/FAD-dependent oxidoreductase [Candidatus Eremiobacteraeota bacterium]